MDWSCGSDNRIRSASIRSPVERAANNLGSTFLLAALRSFFPDNFFGATALFFFDVFVFFVADFFFVDVFAFFAEAFLPAVFFTGVFVLLAFLALAAFLVLSRGVVLTVAFAMARNIQAS